MADEEKRKRKFSKRQPPLLRKNTLVTLMRKVSTLSIRPTIIGGSGGGVPISPNCEFKILVRTIKPEATVSFLIVNMPGFVLSFGKDENMFAVKITSDPKFWERCTFHPMNDLWYESFCAFESIREASRYITYTDETYKCRKYDGTEAFKQDASFVFNKKKQGKRNFTRRWRQKSVSPQMNMNRKRRRAVSSISPPKIFHEKESVIRKFSYYGSASNGNKNRFENGNTAVNHDSGLYSMGFNHCVGCLKLQLYRKDESSTSTDFLNEIRPTDRQLDDVLFRNFLTVDLSDHNKNNESIISLGSSMNEFDEIDDISSDLSSE